MTFAQLWDSIVNLLRSNAASIGIDADHIDYGTLGKALPLHPPFLLVYCLPGSFYQSESTSAITQLASVILYIGAKPQPALHETLKNATEKAGKAIHALQQAHLPMRNLTIDLVEASSSQVVLAVEFATFYDLS